MTSRARAALPVSLLAVGALALAGCSGPAASDAQSDGVIRIVATTSVYGDIAATIAGDAAQVTSIIHDASRDPHEYEATPRDALAVSDADLVIMNGDGYDDFMDALLESHGGHAVVLDAVDISGLDPEIHDDHDADGPSDDASEVDDNAETDDPDHGDDALDHDHDEFNEHVWYSFDAMKALAAELASRLGALDPAGADAFAANAREFASGLDALAQRASGIAAAHPGAAVAITEPVPLYLLTASGLRNTTPDEFSEAVEEGTDAPVLVLQDVVALVGGGSVAFLAYNEQTVGPQTEQVLAAAKAAGTPVVSFSELLPEGLHYLAWMSANLDAIEKALDA